MSLPSMKLAKLGERTVHNLLEGSVFPNEIKESFLPYDIEWKGMKINVKATGQKVRGSKQACVFNIDSSPEHNGVIAVFVALLEDEPEPRFWVEKLHPTIKKYRALKDSVGPSELQERLMLENTRIYNDITTGRSKMVHLKELDWFKAQRLAEMLSEERGHKITVVAAIREAVEVYGEKVWNSKKT